jgi:hypothetical protein
MFIRLNGIPEPPEGYVPPLGSSRETWTNIYKNKGRIDYCVQQFGVSAQHCTAMCSGGTVFLVMCEACCGCQCLPLYVPRACICCI